MLLPSAAAQSFDYLKPTIKNPKMFQFMSPLY